jgi:hypothetical protein
LSPRRIREAENSEHGNRDERKLVQILHGSSFIKGFWEFVVLLCPIFKKYGLNPKTGRHSSLAQSRALIGIENSQLQPPT